MEVELTERQDRSTDHAAMSHRARWEYRVINIRSENYRLDPACVTKLDALGAEGWELVSITSVNFKTGATDNIAMVFKRPVED